MPSRDSTFHSTGMLSAIRETVGGISYPSVDIFSPGACSNHNELIFKLSIESAVQSPCLRQSSFHPAQVLCNLELGPRLLLDLSNLYARRELSEREETLLPIDLEHTQIGDDGTHTSRPCEW